MDLATGSEGRMREMYRSAFADGGADALIEKVKKQNRTLIVAVAAVLACVGALWAAEALAPGGGALDLARAEPGGRARTIAAEAHATYGGAEVDEDVTLRVLPREPDASEAAELIADARRRLPQEILGANSAADQVWSDLDLPPVDEATGVEISWRSSDPGAVANDGHVNPLGAGEGVPVTLTAHLRLGEATDEFGIAIVVTSPPGEYDFTKTLREKIAGIVYAANRSDEGGSLTLPEAPEDGLSIDWRTQRKKGHMAEVLLLAGILGMCIHYRYRSVEKRIASARSQIERDFPDFIGKLGLLLGAGLVITSAIARITEDYEKYRRAGGRRQLYEELVGMRERIRAGNTPLVAEFADIARRSGLREVMRFSSVLADNINKGSALAEKLEQESAMLWDGRKRRAEKEGRIAETRLIFPMVLQVFACVLVTVAPAAFEMH
ncbi:MAG: type II secretion system F family protein [Clostridiales Family XIII bacterium]|nr:type II secretion system F family protein [Clostridiales Family XIII bacterium]